MASTLKDVGEVVREIGGRMVEEMGEAYDPWGFKKPVRYPIRSVHLGDAVNPDHYIFPSGAEVRHISEWLTANAAQALQYIARSSRIDGNNKGDAREDLKKAIRFLEFELERLEVSQ